MANGIRIDELDATVLPSRDHVVPAMKDGLTVKLTVGQILNLLEKVLDPDEVGSKALFAALNLSDLDDPAQARENLGATEIGDALFTAVSKAAGRAAIDALGPSETADRAFRRGNILGTVSQSGGVPTGAIIERGSNANGEYVRFADGTQICRVTEFGAFQTNNASGTDGISVSQDVTWTFPAPFVAPPTVHPAADASNRLMTQFSASPLISVSLRMYSVGAPSPTNVAANVLATGRWF